MAGVPVWEVEASSSHDMEPQIQVGGGGLCLCQLRSALARGVMTAAVANLCSERQQGAFLQPLS